MLVQKMKELNFMTFSKSNSFKIFFMSILITNYISYLLLIWEIGICSTTFVNFELLGEYVFVIVILLFEC